MFTDFSSDFIEFLGRPNAIYMYLRLEERVHIVDRHFSSGALIVCPGKTHFVSSIREALRGNFIERLSGKSRHGQRNKQTYRQKADCNSPTAIFSFGIMGSEKQNQ